MSNTYIKFRAATKAQKTPESIGRRIINKNLTDDVIPIANPDFEDKIADVVFWLIEFENDSYYPNREIGLNASGKPIMIMPWNKNYGYWTDNNLTIENFRANFETISITKAEFESYWKLFTSE